MLRIIRPYCGRGRLNGIRPNKVMGPRRKFPSGNHTKTSIEAVSGRQNLTHTATHEEGSNNYKSVNNENISNKA